MANGGQSSTLRFTCDECGTHLGFDESLAGMEAPCPKCGTVIVAPEPKRRQSRVPSSGVVRGVSGGAGFQANAREREVVPSGGTVSSGGAGSSSGPEGRVKSRKVVPGGGKVPGEVRVLIKILIATALVAFIVVLVTWFLKNQ